MSKSIIKRVDKHAKKDKAQAILVFSNRNNRPYDITHEEYDEQPEGLREEEPSPFPDIPFELPGSDLAEHHKDVAAVLEPDEEAAVEMGARQAAANSGMLSEATPE